MNNSDPVDALSGARTGHICDSCNRSVRTGEEVRVYATRYEDEGWVLRRLWCVECGDTKIRKGTAHADEIMVKAIFWYHRLLGVEILHRSSPASSCGHR